MSRKVLGPINRVEGDLEIRAEVESQQIVRAWVNSPLFRGFEKILLGKTPTDTLVFTPRICGICSVAQSVAAASALAHLQGIRPLTNGRLATNLTLACENLADHLSHFYLFFMPDFARTGYRDQPWFADIEARFKAQTGSANHQVLPARSGFLQMTGLLAGKWPHSLSLQPGGTTKPITRSEQLRLQSIIMSFRNFLEKIVFDDQLETVAALDSEVALKAWRASHEQSDFGRFLMLSESLRLDQMGRAVDRFKSYGAYEQEDGWLFRRGIVDLQESESHFAELDEQTITEDISSSWLKGQSQAVHPFKGLTDPDPDAEGYTWCKAPRLNEGVVEVGALARQVVNAHPLLLDLVARQGGSVYSRVVARLLEFALVVPAMERWCSALDPDDDFCTQKSSPPFGHGVGLVEAARGSLGHWIQVEENRISNYQIIAPTTWNFSPRDSSGVPGALETALQGLHVAGDLEDALNVQHVIRSFDPCMVCTVH